MIRPTESSFVKVTKASNTSNSADATSRQKFQFVFAIPQRGRQLDVLTSEHGQQSQLDQLLCLKFK